MIKQKVVFITEFLNPPFDEGIKKTVLYIFNILNEKFDTLTFSRKYFEHPKIKPLKANKLFLDEKLITQIKIYRPNLIIYLPFQSGTFASYIRQWILQRIFKKSKVVFFTLQPKPLSKIKKLLVRWLKPKYGITASPEVKQFWNMMKVESELIPLFTNLDNFKPIKEISLKQDLRKKYNLPLNSIIIVHIGHINKERNLESLIPLCKENYKVLVVGSSSTPEDAAGPDALKHELINKGMIILDGYIENIQDIYHLSDLYIFPVIEKCGSIGLPLSILEARACGVPVLTTDFGSINYFFDSDFGGITYAEPKDFKQVIDTMDLTINYERTKVRELNELFKNTIERVIG